MVDLLVRVNNGRQVNLPSADLGLQLWRNPGDYSQL
jgi:hypothetical protein